MYNLEINSNIRNLLFNFDTLGPVSKITHQGNNIYKSFIGVFFSLLSLVITFTIIADMIREFFEMNNPNQQTKNIYNKNFSVPLNTQSVKFYLRIEYYDHDKNLIIPLNISQLEDAFAEYGGSKFIYPYLDFYKNTGDVSFKRLEIRGNNFIELCKRDFFANFNNSIEFNKMYPPESYIDSFLGNTFCLPSTFNETLYTNENERLSLSITIPQEYSKIIKTVNNGKYKYLFISFNHQTLEITSDKTYFDNFHRNVWNRKTFGLDSNYMDYYEIYVKNSNITRDAYKFIFPFNNYVKDSILSIERINTYAKTNDDSKGSINFSIFIDNYTNVIQISYVSVDDILGVIGGTYSTLCIIFSYVVEIIIDPLYKSSLINATFDFHENNLSETERNDLINFFESSGENLGGESKRTQSILNNQKFGDRIKKSLKMVYNPKGITLFNPEDFLGNRVDSDSSVMSKSSQNQISVSENSEKSRSKSIVEFSRLKQSSPPSMDNVIGVEPIIGKQVIQVKRNNITNGDTNKANEKSEECLPPKRVSAFPYEPKKDDEAKKVLIMQKLQMVKNLVSTRKSRSIKPSHVVKYNCGCSKSHEINTIVEKTISYIEKSCEVSVLSKHMRYIEFFSKILFDQNFLNRFFFLESYNISSGCHNTKETHFFEESIESLTPETFDFYNGDVLKDNMNRKLCLANIRSIV